jgi:hypothetical protein
MPAMTSETNIVQINGLRTRLKVGMEIHVELATRTKMWTSAPNVAHPDHFDAEPNTLIDPIVIGMPGVLPVMNREAVAMSIKVGLALGCRIARWCKWDRKSYYYPDLPKNYQISQYDLPLCGEGRDRDAHQRRSRRPDCASSASPAPTSKKTPASSPTKRRAVGRSTTPSSTSTAPARRCWKSSPSPTSPAATQAVMFGQTLRVHLPVPRRDRGHHAEGPHAVRAEHQRHHRAGRQRIRHPRGRDQEPQQFQGRARRDRIRTPSAGRAMA